MLAREHQGEEGRQYSQHIVASPEVFDSDEEAKEDAIRKLSALVAGTDTPVQGAIQCLLDDLLSRSGPSFQSKSFVPFRGPTA